MNAIIESTLPEMHPRAVRASLLARREIALLDVREEDPFAQSHPLWAANLPLSRIELDAWGRIPRSDTLIVLYGDGDAADDVQQAAQRLRALGYTQVHGLAGGLDGWRAAGGELFRDVNVPSKAFGEWVEARRHTPSLSAPEVRSLIDARADIVILDARRFDEYQTMSIPGAVSVPGGELVLRVRDLAPNPSTRVIVNCAGRTRSIIGTQSLVNAGIPNPVAALRNGTIGWTLAGQALDRGASRRFADEIDEASHRAALDGARSAAQRAGVAFIDAAQLATWAADATRTTYLFDVRTPEEYAASHRRGFRSAPGGQLVQETDVHAPVRGARIVIADDDGSAASASSAGVRAAMAASWLAQMGWSVAVLEPRDTAEGALESGPDRPPRPAPPVVGTIRPVALADWLAGEHGADAQTVVLDVTTSANHVKGHIPGAWFVLRSRLREALARVPKARRYVVTCGSALLAPYAARDLIALLGPGADDRVHVLEGGTAAWAAAGLPLDSGEASLASPRVDRYRRPYEGTSVEPAAMQAYLDWEFGLVGQLERDGTHHFAPI
jgi:rhodanese-related sulfurtransferase